MSLFILQERCWSEALSIYQGKQPSEPGWKIGQAWWKAEASFWHHGEGHSWNLQHLQEESKKCEYMSYLKDHSYILDSDFSSSRNAEWIGQELYLDELIIFLFYPEIVC